MKPSEAAEIVLMLMAAFPASKTLPTTSAVYECSLADLDAAVARKAVTRLIATRKWLPTVAEIRSAATDLRLGAVRDGGEAWKDAVAAVRYVGRYDVPAFPDPLVSQALRLWGSWSAFCDSPEDDPGGRARFIELYDSLALRRRETEASGIPLPEPASSPRLRLEAARDKLSAAAGRALAQVEAPRQLIELYHPNAKARGVTLERPPEAVPRRYTADELQAALDAKQGAA